MNKYEMMFIVKSSNEESDVKKVADSVSKVAKDNKAKNIEMKDYQKIRYLK